MTVTWTKQASLQRKSVFTAATLNLAVATGDPAAMGSTSTPTIGKIYLTRAYVDQVLTCNNMYTWVTTAGVGLTHCFLGVYDVASTNLLGVTGDISTALQSVGQVQAALAATPGSISGLSYDQEVYMAILVGSGSGTSPQVVANRQFGVNLGLTTDPRFLVTSSATFTSLPSTIPPSAGTPNNASQFIGVGP